MFKYWLISFGAIFLGICSYSGIFFTKSSGAGFVEITYLFFALISFFLAIPAAFILKALNSLKKNKN